MKKISYLLSLAFCVTGCRFPFFSQPTHSNAVPQQGNQSPTGTGIVSPGVVMPPSGGVPLINPVSSISTSIDISPLQGTASATTSIPSALQATESIATQSVQNPQSTQSVLPATPLPQTNETLPPSPIPQATQSTKPVQPPQTVVTPTPLPPPDSAHVVVPISFPQLTLFIDQKDQGKAQVTESADTSKNLLEDAHTLELSPLTSNSQESVAVHIALTSENTPPNILAVYKKSPLVADWLKTDIRVSASTQGYIQVPIPLPSGDSAEYLITGKEKPLPSGVTFENIPPISAPEDPLVTDNAQVQNIARSMARTSKARLRVQSTVHPVIPDKDVIKDPANKKILAVFVHGAGSEAKPGYRWTRLKNFLLTTSAQNQTIRDSFELWSFQYDSTKEIAVNALLLRDAIHAKFGARPYIVIAHSMGGLLAEFLYADEFSRKTFLGMVTLGTPYHGSPFAIPKMYREMASHQALPTLKYIMYWGVSNNFAATIPSPTGQNLAVDPFTDFTPSVFTVGHRCLAFDGFDGEIPTRTYTLPFTVGQEARQLTETLSENDRLCVPCQYSKLYTYPGLTAIPHTSTFPCYFNFAEGLAKLKEYTGSATWPHAFRYAGYFQELIEARYAKVLLFDMAVKNLNGVLHDRSETTEQQALRYAAMDMFALPSVTQGIQSPFAATDGLVHVASALAQTGRASIIDSRSTNGKLFLNETAIEQQKPTDTIAYRLFPGYSHLDIVIGKSSNDARLFNQIATDALWFKSQYDTTLSNTLTWGETNELIQKTEKVVLLGENIDEQLSDGIRIRRATVTSSKAVPSATEQNRATATLTIQKSITVVKNNGTSYSEGTWTETRIATFGRINGVWYWISLQ